MVQVFAGDGCRIILDDQHFPVLISRWEGRITVPVARETFAAIDVLLARGQSEGVRVWSAVDATATKRPDAVTRKTLSELTDAGEERFPGVIRKPSFLAIDSAVVRGALTAMQWISKSSVDVKAYPDLESMLHGVVASLIEEGVEPPPGLDPATYSVGSASDKSA